MSPTEYIEALHTLGLTHITAGQFLGVSWRHSYRWAKGEHAIPKAVAMLLGICINQSLFPEQVEDMAARPAINSKRRALG